MKPLWIWIDPTKQCDLKCKLCYTKQFHREEHLEVSTFKKIIDSIFSSQVIVQKFHLNWKGEPLLNPNLIEIIELLESYNLYFPWEFHTNGTSIDEEYALKLMKTIKTGSIYVSIDGGNKVSHEFNRGPNSFDKTISGLEYLINAKDKIKSSAKIGVFQIDLGVPDNEYDKNFIRLTKQVDDWVRVQPFHPINGAQIDVNAIKTKSKTKNNKIYTPANRWWLLNVPDKSYLPNKSCFWAGNALFFETDGSTKICLMNKTSDGFLGNINDNRLTKLIDNAENFRDMIESKGRQNVSHCKGCKFLEGEPKIQITKKL